MLDSDSITRGRRAFDRLLRASFAAMTIAAMPLVASAQDVPVTANLVSQQSANVAVLVELEGAPAARVFAATFNAGKPNGATQARDAAVSEARVQISRNESEQQRFSATLAQSTVKTSPIYRVTKALNGLAYTVKRSDIARLRALPGVKAVHLIQQEYPTLSTSVPFLGTAAAWSGASPLGVTGQGVRIGIIDTGVDYQHATFGGTGLLADYQANDRTVVDAFFPSARVVGGTDFAGDAYTGGNAPAPDPDPMDCNGHGTHVASTAAGGGVKADGTPFTGPYDGTTPFNALRVGPGVAPQALVYALRVFGCSGSTNLTVAAIEWSLDPNNDNDLSDHLDVINMSLGSNYGTLADTTAMASDNASRMGVVVVASAGNAGDTYFIGGSPGSGQRVIAIAATGDSGLGAGVVRINTPASIAGTFNGGTSSMATAGGQLTPNQNNETSDVVIATPLNGCAALTNAAAVTGKIVLIDRGTCGFAVKYDAASAAGAIGVIIGNNSAAAPAGMSGVVATANIPAVMILQSTATAIKAQIAGGTAVNVTLPIATQADVLASFSSRGPIGGGGVGNVKPDLSAPGISITAAQTGVTCTAGGCLTPDASGYLPDGQTLTISGTSMAAPHAAGVMALLVQRFPDRSAEELKALVMNTSLHDIFQYPSAVNRVGVDRSGSGRVDPVKALQGTVAAFNNDVTGAVSLSFVGEVVGSLTQTQKLRVVNYGSTAQTFTLAFDIASDAPGIAFSLPGGNSVTVPAGGTVILDVQVSATAAQMNHTRDITADALQAAPAPLAGLGSMPRHYLTNKNGYINFTQGSATALRVPVYAALRPASDIAAPNTIATGGNPTGSTTIALSGPDVCTGTLAAGPTCTGTFPVTDVSRVSPFELQGIGPLKPSIRPSANIKHVGVAYDAATNLILFGITTWGDWGSATETPISILVNAAPDLSSGIVLFSSNPGSMSPTFGGTGTGQDTFINSTIDLATGGAALRTSYVNRLSAAQANSALYGSNVIILAATPAQLGLAVGTTNFQYKVQTCEGFNPLCAYFGEQVDEVAGPFAWDYAAQGLNFNGTHMAQDLNGATLPVTWNTANMTTNASLGALLLHHHNGSGKRAQVVALQGATSTDLAVTQTLTPAAPTQGQNVTIAVSATNNGPTNATGVVVNAPLPAGLTYVSDTGAGAYNSGTGVWTVGALTNAQTTSISIVATVSGSGNITMMSAISGDQVDTNSVNDSASNTITVAAQTALAVTNVLATASPVLAGGASTFNITVKNTGVDTLLNVSLSAVRLPAATITASTPSSGSFNNATGVWTIASIAGGATVTLSITITAPSMAGPLTVTASGTAENAPAASQAASVNVISPALVTATKTVTGATYAIGSSVTYSVTLSNTAATAQLDNPGNEFTDVLPSGLTLVSATASSGTAVATIGTNTVTWNGVIAASASVTITITATVNAGTAGSTISNQGTAAFDADGNGTNESTVLTDDPAVTGPADSTSFVVRNASVTATKVVAVASPAAVGGGAVYTIVLSNSGNAATLDNPGDELTDVLPFGVTLTSATATSGTAIANTGTGTVTWNGSIAANGSVTITINTVINNLAPGILVSNQARYAFDADLNGSNESTGVTDDPTVAGTANATTFAVAPLIVPTLSNLALILLSLMIFAWGANLTLRRFRQ